MKNRSSVYLSTLLVLFFVSQIFASSWKSLGLDSLRVNTLFSTNNSVMAGTEKGLYLYGDASGKWIKYNGIPDLPVTDIIQGKSGELFVSVDGNGSKSDGIYVGLDMLDGEPYYEFKAVKYGTNIEEIEYFNDTLIYGGGNNIYSATRLLTESMWPVFSEGKKVAMPEYSFGVEQPYCSEIKYLKTAGEFFVTGYDKSPMASNSKILSGNSKELSTFFETASTSLLEKFYSFTGASYLYAGTLDGVYKFSIPSMIVSPTEPVLYPTRLSAADTLKIATPNNVAVNHITTTTKGEIVFGSSGYICISTATGVYLTNDDKSWLEVGDIPVIPNMTIEGVDNSQKESSTSLYSATDKGVYKYLFDETATLNSNKSNLKKADYFKIYSNQIDIDIPNSYNNMVEVNLYAMSGKLVKSINYENKKSITIALGSMSLSSGSYLLVVKSNDNYFEKSFYYLK